LSLLAFASNNKFPLKFRPDYVSMVALLGLVGFIGSMAMLRYAVEAKVFDGELQAKMERQISHPYGLLIGGRPQTAASLYAISKKPIFGHGTTAYDPEVWNLLTAISIMNYFGSDRYEQLLEMGYNPRHRHHATPSHSHLLSAWSDAGIMAALCWLAFLGLTVYVLLRAMLWNNPWSPLFTYLSLTALWNILFSPGPVRMDTALTVMVFAFAVHLFQAFDKMEATRLRT
jgi:O-antigen ligase